MTGTDNIQAYVNEKIDQLNSRLRDLNRFIHENPELAFKEYKSHDAICDFLEELGFKVTRHAYGIETAFEAIYGEGGRIVNFNAEYDALPGGGHMCGHNLIATASISGFLGAAYVLEKTKAPGRVQLLGTPAEEAGGGKCDLIDAGAYKGVSASLMAHGFGSSGPGIEGFANSRLTAAQHSHFTFKGKIAHAGAYPWDGVNAMDSFVAMYNNVSLLRQQIRPCDRMHCCLEEGPKVANIIPAHTKVLWIIRSDKLRELKKLNERVENCARAAALATGCEVEIERNKPYADIIFSDAINNSYIKHMGELGVKVGYSSSSAGSTDMGNVSQIMPSIHANFSLPEANGSNPHQKEFATAAGKDSSHDMTIKVGKSLAQVACDLITDDKFFQQAYDDWQKDLAA